MQNIFKDDKKEDYKTLELNKVWEIPKEIQKWINENLDKVLSELILYDTVLLNRYTCWYSLQTQGQASMANTPSSLGGGILIK